MFVPLASAAKLFHHVLKQCFAESCSITNYKVEHPGLPRQQTVVLTESAFFPFVAKRYNIAHSPSTTLPLLRKGMFDAVSGFLFSFLVQTGRAEACFLLDLILFHTSDFWCHLWESTPSASSLQLQVSTFTSL